MTMNSNNILGIIIIGVIVYFVFIGGDKWTGFYYLDQNDLTNHIKSPKFGSVEECRGWVKDQARVLNPDMSVVKIVDLLNLVVFTTAKKLLINFNVQPLHTLSLLVGR